MFWEATPDDKRIFVANPRQASRHNRGCAVDLTLYDRRTRKTAEMVGVYDEMTERSYPDYPGGTSLQRWHRAPFAARHGSRRLHRQRGRVVALDYRDWNQYRIGNVAFERIKPE
jgi:D-alanyl-D-alanine dipeptidase